MIPRVPSFVESVERRMVQLCLVDPFSFFSLRGFHPLLLQTFRLYLRPTFAAACEFFSTKTKQTAVSAQDSLRVPLSVTFS